MWRVGLYQTRATSVESHFLFSFKYIVQVMNENILRKKTVTLLHISGNKVVRALILSCYYHDSCSYWDFQMHRNEMTLQIRTLISCRFEWYSESRNSTILIAQTREILDGINLVRFNKLYVPGNEVKATKSLLFSIHRIRFRALSLFALFFLLLWNCGNALKHNYTNTGTCVQWTGFIRIVNVNVNDVRITA